MYKHHKVRTTKTSKQIERNKSISDNVFRSTLFVLAASALFFAVLIIAFIFVKGIFGAGTLWDGGDWLFGNKYDGAVFFAAGFMVVNTIWASFIAVLIALPISVLTALFITRVAPESLRPAFFIVLSILAAIPSVVYGAFGSKAIDSLIMWVFGTGSGSLLTIVVTLAFMIMPTITLITTTSINMVDRRLEHSSLALGATKNQTSFKVTLRAASTGILTATILGVGRAIGEATAVSMISVDPYTGPSFGLFENIRLLTATMLKGYNEMEPGSQQEASMFAMGMLLILTILSVFLSMRFAQKLTDPVTQSKKAARKIRRVNKLENDIKTIGLANMPVYKQKRYYRLQDRHALQKEYDAYYHEKYRKKRIILKTTVKPSHEKQKELNSKFLGSLTWVMAMIGVVFLISIIMFLLILGTPGLSWIFLTSADEGIKSALFGTLLLIVLSMAMIIPLGVCTGIYFAVFAKDTWGTKVLTTGIDILTGIPSLIFGLVGAAVFLPLANSIGFAPLAGALILTLIVVPTVVQTTQEAIRSVPSPTISGSLALGSTKTTSSLKIALPQAMPQIVGGIVLSIGRIVGESAAIVMVFGTVSRNNAGEWMQFGGTTLATEMYKLTLMEEIDWEAVAAIGIVILSLVMVLSLLSSYITRKNKIGIYGILIALLLLLSGIFIGFVIGLIIFLIGVLMLFATLYVANKWGGK